MMRRLVSQVRPAERVIRPIQRPVSVLALRAMARAIKAPLRLWAKRRLPLWLGCELHAKASRGSKLSGSNSTMGSCQKRRKPLTARAIIMPRAALVR